MDFGEGIRTVGVMSSELFAAIDALGRLLPCSAQGVQTADDLMPFLRKVYRQQQPPSSSEEDLMHYYISYTLTNALATVITQLKCGRRSMAVSSSSGRSTEQMVSVRQCQIVYTALEMMWMGGLGRTVVDLSGSNLLIPTREVPRSMLFAQPVVVQLVDSFLNNARSTRFSVKDVFAMTRCIEDIIFHELFSNLMLVRNLSRVLLSYLTLRHVLPQDEPLMTKVESQLSTILLSPYKTAAVTSLSSIAKGPTWLSAKVAETLTGILLSETGLQAVIAGYLSGKFLDD